MPRSSDVEVRLRLRGARTFQTEVAASAKTLEALGSRGAASLARFAAQADRLKTVGRSMTTGVTLPLAAVGFLAVKTAADFERSMAQVGVALDVPTQRLGGLRDLAMKMGADTIFSANEASLAMLELAKAGMSEAQIKGGALAATMNLAAAGGIELADAAVQVGSAMNTFGLKARKATTIADALAGGANASSANLSDLALALQQAGQQAVASGLSLHETVGTLAAFADAGIRGSDAGTSLKTFLQRLNPITVKAKSLMKELGLSFFDAEGRMLPMTGIAKELRSGLKGMTQEQRLAALQTLFGSDALRAANIVWSQGAGGLRGYIKATKERGAAQKMADAQMKGLPGALERLKGSLETAALAAGTQLAPTISTLAGVIGSLANAFTMLPGPTQKFLVGALALLAVTGPMIWIFGQLATAAGWYLIALKALKTGVIATRIEQAKWIVGMALARVRLIAMSAATKIAAAAQWLLNAAMVANPIILIVAAIIALGAAFVLAYTKIGWFRNAVDAAWGWIKGAFIAGKNAVVGAVNAILGFVRKHWKLILAIMTGPIGLLVLAIVSNFGKIRNAATAVVSWVVGRFKSMIGFFTSLPGKMAAATKNVFTGLWTGFKGVINSIIRAWNGLELRIDPGKIAMPLGPDVDIPGITIGTPDIPELGSGGSILQSGSAIVGDKGEPELLHLPRGAVVEPLGPGGDIVLPITLELDSEPIYRKVIRRSRDERARG